MNPAPLIADIFAKDINRPIEGVIKADDAANLATEIDEYVLTGETASALLDLLDSYNSSGSGGNGVWISGFFGSGKSHLLKMLAHLLGDVAGQSITRQDVVVTFAGKAIGDSMLTAALGKAASIPATTLLFNIDQKAPLIDKSQTDALLQVFLKVFNEVRGYYGNDPSVARFERDLDRRGLLDQFRQAFEQIAGVPWAQGREEGILQEHAVTQAWSMVTGEPPSDSILGRYEDKYTLSIEEFADEVKDWLDGQSPDHRLLFMADEVGQFIGTNTKLMLNLQTIVESLATRCHGRAWVFVTSQEDIEGVIGDRTKTQANDFSKIQARFVAPMRLTSRDLEEVIKRRLLDKTDAAAGSFAGLYHQQRPNFRTLFDFVDGAKSYRNYSDQDDFTDLYPFVPYQLALFQDALIGLSLHNVFEGRHSSVGERSMLGVVQEVGKQMTTRPVGALVSLDAMFAGIAKSVKSTATRNLTTAQNLLPAGSETAIRLLMALFLVKYVEGFKATPRNLAVLLIDHFGQDLTVLGEEVRLALDTLERETYVQRSGSSYEYLTNEEQDIEQEIKGTGVDSGEISGLLAKLIVEDVAKTNSWTHAATGRVFKYGLQLDDSAYGRQHTLSVHYISPALGQDQDIIKAQSMGRPELRVVLAHDPRLYGDLKLHLQTDKYVKLTMHSGLTETRRYILESRTRLNRQRRDELVKRIRGALANSTMVINGAQVAVTATEPEARLDEGVGQLVATFYTRLPDLGGVAYSEPDIAKVLANDPVLLAGDFDKLQPPAAELASYINQQRAQGAMVTVKKIMEQFEDRPYGWPPGAILCVIAKLFATDQVTLHLDGSELARTQVAEVLRNTANHPNVEVTEQRQFDQAKVNQVRTFVQEFSAENIATVDPRDLAAQVKLRLEDELRRLEALRSAHGSYPFINGLDQPISRLTQVVNRPTSWYLDQFTDYIDQLLEAKQDFIDPISSFLNSSQKDVFDEASHLLAANQDNRRYLTDGQAERVEALLADPNLIRTGANRLKDAAAAFKVAAGAIVNAEREAALEQISARIDVTVQGDVLEQASPEVLGQVQQIQERVLAAVAAATSIPVIKQLREEFAAQGFLEILELLEPAGPKEAGPTPRAAPIVSIRSLPAPAPKVLQTVADVDAYVEELRVTLQQAIDQGKRISL
ncbi:MAG: BREX system P-loop protein BrxC [Micrococcales bacterium]|nr:BREX system P-loop protein BrxC [Micrococcales bacterium]